MVTKSLILIAGIVFCISFAVFQCPSSNAEEDLPLPVTGYHKRNAPVMGEAGADETKSLRDYR